MVQSVGMSKTVGATASVLIAVVSMLNATSCVICGNSVAVGGTDAVEVAAGGEPAALAA